MLPEIGPVDGNDMEIILIIYNSQDGMAFYYMWHWDNSQARETSDKALPKIGEDIMLTYDNKA